MSTIAYYPQPLGWLSPVESVDGGLLLKREDLYAYANGVNGSKLRGAEQLIARAMRGHKRIVTAAACISPQHAIVASVGQRFGAEVTSIIGGTTPSKAVPRYPSLQIAARAGAQFRSVKVGYNPNLIKAAREYAGRLGAYWLHYGITPEPEATTEDLIAFHATSARQVVNIPGTVKTVVIPFGSGNTGAGVLMGLADSGPKSLEQVILVAIGPDKIGWLSERLARMGVADSLEALPFDVQIFQLHRNYATYGVRMPESIDGVDFHPTYEGKVVRWLNEWRPEWWTARGNETLLWVVGGPLPATAKGDQE